MTLAATLLKQTRLACGLSTRALARQGRTASARVSEIERSVHDPSVDTLERLVGAAGWQVVIIPSRAPTAAAVASLIGGLDVRARDGEERGFRALLSLSDGLSTAPADVRVALCVAPPPFTGDPRFDAAVAGIVEYHLRRSRLPVPSWVLEVGRSLPASDAWVPDPHAGPDIVSETPASLRRHGVLLAERELVST